MTRWLIYFRIGILLVVPWLRTSAQGTTDYGELVRQDNSQLQAGNNEQALASANTAIKVNASRWEAYAVAGGALLNLKRYEEAADQFSHAIDHAPEAKKAGLRDLRKQCLLAESGASPNPPSGSAAAQTTQAEIVLWKTIEHSTNIADFQAYLQQYPNGAFIALAQNHLKAQGDTLVNQGMDHADQGNSVAAANSYKEACDIGNARGCDFLGNLYFNGFGVPRDHRLAAQLLQKACDEGYGAGCRVLGEMYSGGDGVSKDEVRAQQLAQRASQLPSVDPVLAGRDATTAENYARDCDRGVGEACINLATVYY
jgi:TPR repeat protein